MILDGIISNNFVFVDVKSNVGTDNVMRRYISVIMESVAGRDVGNLPCDVATYDAMSKLSPYTSVQLSIKFDHYKKDYYVSSFKVLEK